MVEAAIRSAPGFASDGYALVLGLVEPAACSFLREYVAVAETAGRFKRDDPAMPDTPSCYGDPFMEALLERLLPRVELHSGRSLSPTYSYFRHYKRGDVLSRHTDRPSCEISVTMNLSHIGPRPWPLWIEAGGVPRCLELGPGDAVLYRGIDLPHWREAFDGTRSLQVFLHYVDRDGPGAEWVFDKRAGLSTSDAARQVIRRLMSDLGT